MMRRPLDRRMFMNPQQRRGMARMPQGILASGPRIMNAAMQQQAPVRMANGGSVQTGLGMSGFMDFLNQYVLGSRNQIGGSSTTDESVGALDPAPGPDTGSSADVGPLGPADPDSEVIIDRGSGASPDLPTVLPVPNSRRTVTVPGSSDALATNVTEQYDDTLGGALPPPSDSTTRSGGKDEEEGFSLQGLLDDLDKLGNKENQTTDQYITKSMDLLKKYNIKAPDLDARRKDRILQFFLEMAAGESPDALTNVTKAAKSAGMGFAEDRRDVEKATQDFQLAGVQMGLAEQQRDEAAAQAVLLKKYDITADVLKELNKDTKMNQIQGLMNLGVSQSDAIGYVFKGDDPSVFMEKFSRFKNLGLGDGVSTFMAASPQATLESIRDNPQLGVKIANLVVKGGGEITEADAEYLGVDYPYGVQVRVNP